MLEIEFMPGDNALLFWLLVSDEPEKSPLLVSVSDPNFSWSDMVDKIHFFNPCHALLKMFISIRNDQILRSKFCPIEISGKNTLDKLSFYYAELISPSFRHIFIRYQNF